MTRNIKISLILLLAIILLAEKLMHPHAVFGIEGTPLFHAWFGFAACLSIIMISKILGLFLQRKKDYYKENDDVI